MLILSRIIGKSVIIGNDIEVVVLDIKGKSVRLGIHAPREISVDREEIYRRKQKQQLHPFRQRGNGVA